ncbi:MAG TPA: patatin-like phospholipase family protein [Caulobacteraceae bacterium]|nr:patatin-like phospholipase family protein [Caulobacteraceae bacterium]
MALALAAGAPGCATPSRLEAPPAPEAAQADPGHGAVRYFVARDTEGFADEARNAFRKEVAWRQSIGQTGPLPAANLLAISGGGDNGAFTAGLLNGWTAHGDRPEFKAVTGVSTGALISPFAFLGSRYDGALKSVYTEVSQRNIFLRRNLHGYFSDALSDTTPLYDLTARYVDRNMLDQIAAEYAKGRLLLVATTNLDSLEPVVWNMTAIAASHDPRALELFRRILVASASIPGAFPPVMIDVEVDGVHYQEMHVDGGAMSQVFAYPASLNLGAEAAAMGADRQRNLYIIRNARLDPEWASVKRRTLSIAGRAISSLMQTQGIGDLYRIYVTAQRDQIAYNLAYIPPSFTTPHTKQFDTTYMRSLYQKGYDQAAGGYPWRNSPPGYDSPFIAAAK